MTSTSDEGYETLVICPYDKSHKIRKGKMHIHLGRCRRNFPKSQLVECPYNKGHLIPEKELNYHIEECGSRTWMANVHDEKTPCPVKDLVPVNAATVPDGGENWDDFEAAGSVLDYLQEQALSKPILRTVQGASKAQRKLFKTQERERHRAFRLNNSQTVSTGMSDTSSDVAYHIEECGSRTWMANVHDGKTPCPVKDLVPVNAATVPDGGENWDDYHIEECGSRTWMANVHDGKTPCPVKDLVPVNAATVPDGGENWDDYHIEECGSRTWMANVHDGKTPCPVKDLVPVNAATVPDGGENWDDIQTLKKKSMEKEDPAVAGGLMKTSHVTSLPGPSSMIESKSTSQQIPFSYAATLRSGIASDQDVNKKK